jgi:hypothetical protein
LFLPHWVRHFDEMQENPEPEIGYLVWTKFTATKICGMLACLRIIFTDLFGLFDLLFRLYKP